MPEVRFSVIMPTFNQCGFIRRAILSLMQQTYHAWELLIVNDGCTDATEDFIGDYLTDERVTYIRNTENTGLGHALNQGLDAARGEYIAYLPSDDYYDENHLDTLKERFRKYPRSVVVYSGIRFDDSPRSGILSYKTCKGAIPGYCLQLVQTAHRKTEDRWRERDEMISDDLNYTFWHKLMGRGSFAPTNIVSCCWTNHPHQRHKICSEKYGGGLNKYRHFYGVKTPLRFRATKYKIVDEEKQFASYRNAGSLKKDGGLKILLVGELAYNPERVYALEQAGHKLYGLWARPRFGFSTIGHLPFGNVEDVPYENWKSAVSEIAPDVIYALLSTGAIELAHEVLIANTGIPFVWHFKEGPHEAMKDGLWKKLIDLYTYADGRIYLNEEIKAWFEQFVPVSLHNSMSMVMDGDLPKKECFDGSFSKKLSASDGELHTVVTGRIIGLSPEEFSILASNKIHLHLYSENEMADPAILHFQNIAPRFFHVHKHCAADRWVEEFSRYDAGWLHCIGSANHGSLMKAIWSDLNLPARINTLAAAGLPMILRNDSAHLNAQYNYVMSRGMGVDYSHIAGLVERLKDKEALRRIRKNVKSHRDDFIFDSHVRLLTDFFKDVINLHDDK